MKMRGYGNDSKETIVPWVLDTYRSDAVHNLCPLTADDVLLKAEPAWQAAVRALRAGCQEVYYPLGLRHSKILAYKAIKASGFIFRTPAQFKKLSRQIERFTTRTACGLELLCFRRSYAGKEAPSLSSLACDIYQYIQTDGQDLSKHFNLTRLSKPLVKLVARQLAKVADRRQAAQRDLFRRIDVHDSPSKRRKRASISRTRHGWSSLDRSSPSPTSEPN